VPATDEGAGVLGFDDWVIGIFSFTILAFSGTLRGFLGARTLVDPGFWSRPLRYGRMPRAIGYEGLRIRSGGL
jgi:hypothetical protein